jgi:ABC-2 type transport system permease protein
VGRGDLIRKINFPKYIIVVSGSISALINLFISLAVVLLFILAAGISLRPEALLLPFLIAELYIFALALAFFLSALFVKYRDVNYIWELVMQAGIYATPIIYPLSLVIEKSQLAAKLLLLNPVAQIIQDARYVLITTKTDTLLKLTDNWFAIMVPPIVVIAVIITASVYFRANAKHFAENV